MRTINKDDDLKEKLLNGNINADLARKLLQMLMETPAYQHVKVTLKDKREFYGSLIYLDGNRMLLTNCEEHYKGYERYVRHFKEILIPIDLADRVEMKKKQFDEWYNQL